MNNREHNFISNVVYIYNNEKEIDYFLTKIANCMVAVSYTHLTLPTICSV